MGRQESGRWRKCAAVSLCEHTATLVVLAVSNTAFWIWSTSAWSRWSTFALRPVAPQVPTESNASLAPDEKVPHKASLGAQESTIHVDPDTRQFVDQSGRTRIFHGVNVVFKQPPFVPDAAAWSADLSFSKKDAQDLRSWGFNLIRLGVLWSGTFPASPHRPDPSYLDAVARIVELCAEEGIYVIVDMHSDVMSRRFCGNGIPDWAVDRVLRNAGQQAPLGDFPAPLYDQTEYFDLSGTLRDGSFAAEELAARANATTASEVEVSNAALYPKLSACLQHDFFEYYTTHAALQTAHALYTDAANLTSAFEQHWKCVAERFKSHPAVLMYEIMNEPYMGRTSGPKFWLPLQWLVDNTYEERPHIAGFQGRLRDAILSVDAQHVVASEPIMWTYWDRRLGRPSDEAAANNLNALSWHLYCPWAPDKAPWLPLAKLCVFINAAFFSIMAQNTRDIGGGSILTEFGSLGGTEPELRELADVVRLADQRLHSMVYWQYKSYRDITSSGGYGTLTFYEAEGKLQTAKVRTLATPYAQIVAGTPTFMRFEPITRIFTFQYTASGGQPEVERESLLHIGKLQYPSGFLVFVDAELTELKIRLFEDVFLELRHSAKLSGEKIAVCILPCPDGQACSGEVLGRDDALAQSFWHPCGIRFVGFWWGATYLAAAGLLLQLVTVDVYWRRRYYRIHVVSGDVAAGRELHQLCGDGGQDAVVSSLRALDGDTEALLLPTGAREARRLYYQTSWCLGIAMALAAFVATTACTVWYDIPFHDELMNWLMYVALLQPLLWASVLSDAVGPRVCVCIVAFVLVWRFSHFILDRYLSSWRLLLAARLAFVATSGAALFVLARHMLSRTRLRGRSVSAAGQA
eukprot:TRINITY_DN25236_c0_g1_i3.p1 TRINITY_DN25236_c0_g1~~TRINITY_DN25236_c0_g1_i3.p1  ORF type:complete len:861 (-),score=106.77 TRINITY_DN25236_c0_g1_i3:111-2693(-)